jgi:PadR family transcriptional regulator PadR
MQLQKQPYRDRIELLQGTLDLLILTTLQWGPQHGYAVSLAIKANSGDVLRVETGSLYPALHRLEKQGWVASEWKHTEANQRAKFYRLTAGGKRQLAAEQSRWQQLVTAMAAAMNAGLKESES